MQKKLTLENFIFWRAAQLQTAVYTNKKGLFSVCLDPYLQVTMYLYNQCFPFEKATDCLVVPEQLLGGVKNGWLLPSPRKSA